MLNQIPLTKISVALQIVLIIVIELAIPRIQSPTHFRIKLMHLITPLQSELSINFPQLQFLQVFLHLCLQTIDTHQSLLQIGWYSTMIATLHQTPRSSRSSTLASLRNQGIIHKIVHLLAHLLPRVYRRALKPPLVHRQVLHCRQLSSLLVPADPLLHLQVPPLPNILMRSSLESPCQGFGTRKWVV